MRKALHVFRRSAAPFSPESGRFFGRRLRIFRKTCVTLPENSRHAGAVHKNITISGNVFENVQKVAVSAKSTDSLTLENNRLEKGELLQTKNCTNIALR